MKIKKPFKLCAPVAALAATFVALSNSPLHAQVTAGADFENDASADTDADSAWEDQIGTSGYEWYLDTANGVARVAVSGVTQFTHAYDFPGGFSGDTPPNSDEAGYGGAKLVLVGETGECRSFRDVGYDNQDATLEFWIKPDTLTHTTTNGQVIWEDGGGTGYGLFINDNVLYSDNDGGNDAPIAYDLSADSLGLLLGAPTAEFIQVVLTRVAATGAEEMFINGISVGTATDSGGNWSGGDGTGLGARGEANVGGQGNGDDGTESFDGQIALFRIYNQQILTPAEVLANFLANAGTPQPDFEVDATADSDADDRWEDLVDGNPSGAEFLLDSTTLPVTRVAATGTSLAITHAYDFPGGAGETTNGGGLLVNTGTTTGVSTEALGWDQQKVMVEIWFRPDNIAPSAGNGQILWETGGGSGLGFFIDDNKLVFSHDNLDADGLLEYDLSTDPGPASNPGPLLLGAATAEFIQAVGSYDPTTGDMELFINGVSVATTTSVDASFNDWSGSDPSGLGTRGGSNAGGFGNGSPGFNSYDGEIMRMRFYIGAVLDDADVLASFQEQSAPDNTAPTADVFSPLDDATGLYVATDLSIEFSEPVVLGASGTITIKETGGATFATYDLSVANPELSISGNTLTIDPATNLLGGKDYHVEITSGAIADPYGNDFAGFTDPTIWNFQTVPADATAPAITLLSPLDDAINVSQSATLVATFDDDLLLGSGDIRINEVGGSTLQTISITDASQVTLAGNVLTINPASNLSLSADIAIQIDSGALINFNDLSFAGIGDNTTWNFTVESFPAPVAYWPLKDGLVGTTVSSTGGADDLIDAGLTFNTATGGGSWGADASRGIVYSTGEGQRLNAGTQGIDRTVGFTWSFWANVAGSNATDPGADTIIGTRSGGTWHKVQIDGSSNWAGVSYGGSTSYDTWHHFAYVGDSTSVRMYVDGVLAGSDTTTPTDTFNGPFEFGGASNFSEDITGLMSEVAVWQTALSPELITLLATDAVSIVEDLTAPVLAATSPADETSDVFPSVPLQVIFDELVTLGTGDIRIVNMTDSSTTTIAVTDGSQVTVSGAAITINPNPGTLVPGKLYAIEMDAGVVANSSAGLPFGGILDQTTWNFTTATPATGLLVYEGFQYADPVGPDGLEGQPNDPGATDTDADGLIGVWTDATTISTGNLFLKSGSLVFGDHASAGNHVGSNTNLNNDVFHRDLTADAQFGVSGNAEVWFSFLAEKPQNDNSAAEGGVVISNQILGASQVGVNDGTDGLIGFGIAPTTNGNNWTAYAWNGSSQVVGDAVLSVGIGTGDVRLLVGNVSFDSGTGGADVFTIYEYQLSGGSTISGGALSQIGSPLEIDFDQSTLGTLNVTRQVNTNYDEIRIGTSLADVVPGAINPGSTPYDSWASGFLPDDVSDPAGNFDSDTLSNLLEFAFGTDPTISDAVSLNPDGSVNGLPIVQSSGSGGGITFDFVFVQRDDAGDPGSVSYTPQFSNDLLTWYNSTVTPNFVADSTDDAAYEVVSVPYPATLPNGKKARFARMQVDEVP